MQPHRGRAETPEDIFEEATLPAGILVHEFVDRALWLLGLRKGGFAGKEDLLLGTEGGGEGRRRVHLRIVGREDNSGGLGDNWVDGAVLRGGDVQD